MLPVDPRLSLSTQYDLLGVTAYFNTGRVTNRTAVPDRPYVIWTRDGQLYRPYSVDEALELFAPDEVGATLGEVTALYAQHPDFFKGRGIDASGSRDDSYRVPYLNTFYGNARVSASRGDYHDSRWGALSRGNEVAIGH